MRKLPIIVASAALALCLTGCDQISPKVEEADDATPTDATESQQVDTASDDGLYYSGRYVVGKDIPAGGYVLTIEDLYLENGNSARVKVFPDSETEDEILSEHFISSYHVSVSEGQVLEVSGATFIPA